MTTPLDLLASLESERLICTLPRHWHDFWKLLGRQGDEDAPKPLILAGWNFSNDAQRQYRFAEQIHWAARNGRLEAAVEFLGALRSEDWHVGDVHAELPPKEPDRADEIEAIAARIDTNTASFAAQRRKLEHEGVDVVEGIDPQDDNREGFVACHDSGEVIAFAKTEDGAWAKAWAALHGEA